ncbi:unnamed protein product [Chondrus crispus]|uniref:Uncharacterized protein n=1 Tax=Chondrus crispus TaxID=2769 RepID=R7Q8U1_CHOCR|nr:unnamed protein product [Chondrus crispus]CDF34937.1 unnamed protein product [Chondrus crispus]|eukprot:XP_005714756.1 unnamed protein product [Chondrus crispus]
MPTSAPIAVLTKFTNSFDHCNLSCSAAPMNDSAVVAINAARTTIHASVQPPSKPTYSEYTAAASDANAPAPVPSKLTAPSVPRGTNSNVVTRYVVFPYAFPISLAIVSDNFVARDAVYPSSNVS